jgi:REP element-mobilizing transposase RayT
MIAMQPYRPCGTSKIIGSIVRGFKIGVTQRVRQKMPGMVVRQRNYFEHIVRDEYSLYIIRKYIRENPVNWVTDRENHIVL